MTTRPTPPTPGSSGPAADPLAGASRRAVATAIAAVLTELRAERRAEPVVGGGRK